MAASKQKTAATATRPHANTRNTNAPTGQTIPNAGKTGLDPRTNLMQERFARYYTETGRVAESAVRAGYSPASADSIGSQLLRNPKVSARIADLVNEALEAEGVGKAAFITALAARAMAALTTTLPDVAEFDCSGMSLKDGAALSRTHRLAIKKASSSPGQNGPSQSIELHDSVPMVMALAKLGGWEAPQRVEVEQNTTLNPPVDTSSMTADELNERILAKLSGR